MIVTTEVFYALVVAKNFVHTANIDDLLVAGGDLLYKTFNWAK